VLLDARTSNLGAEFLDISGDRDRLDIFQAEAMVLAPVEAPGLARGQSQPRANVRAAASLSDFFQLHAVHSNCRFTGSYAV